MARSHVPKFGNWENEDNVPYEVYFDEARKKKDGRKMINPNDPEMFANTAHVLSNENMGRGHMPYPPASNQSSERSHPPASNQSSERSPFRSARETASSERGTPVGSQQRPNESLEKGAAASRFGQWNENDPSSGENFTHIFNKVREERNTRVGKVMGTPNEPKKCCFPWW